MIFAAPNTTHAGDAVVSVDHKVPVDEALFEDMDDLDLED